MTEPYRTSRRVQFHETDAAGIAHFSAFFTYMEEAEHEFLRHVGLSVLMQDDDGRLSWPRVAAACDFSGMVKFEDVVDIAVTIGRVGKKSVTYTFDFFHDGETIAEGRMTACCCRLSADGPPTSIAIPPWIREKLAS